MSLKFLTAGILLAMTIVAGCSKGYESTKNVNDLTITLKAESYPLVKSDNALLIRIEDSAKKPVTDATVNVRYFMPAMPGMAPMEYTTQAVQKGSAYHLTANIPMEGGWKVEVNGARPNAAPVTTVFNLDAR